MNAITNYVMMVIYALVSLRRLLAIRFYDEIRLLLAILEIRVRNKPLGRFYALYMYNQKRECTNYYLGMKILYKNECCKNSYMKNSVVLPRVILMLIATRVSFWLLEAKCFMRDLERRNMNGRDIFCKP